MKILILLFLMISCTSYKPKRFNNHALNFVALKTDPQSINSLKNILHEMTPQEKEIIVKGYLKFYKYAMRRACNFKVDLEPGPGIPRLGISPLTLTELNAQGLSDKNSASFLDLSTDVKTQSYYYMGKEGEMVNQVMFNNNPVPENIPTKDQKYDLILLRSGVVGNSKFTVCAIHTEQENLCVEDSLTDKFVNTQDQQKFCKWLDNPGEFSGAKLNDTVFELLNVLYTIEILEINKFD